MLEITSSHNPRIQHIRALLNQKSSRVEENLFVVEGVRLAEEALASGMTPTEIFTSANLSSRGRQIVEGFRLRGCAVVDVTTVVMDSLSATETSQGILLVLPQALVPLPPQANFVLILDQLRDPGNLGTALRTAAAAGVQVVFLPPGNADVYSPKVVRAGMGAHFRLCVSTSPWPEIIQYCKTTQQPPLKLLLAESADGKICWQTNLVEPLALIIGGEADGASQEARSAAEDLIHIPMPGNFESLNAAVSAGILLFDVVRQRSKQ